MGADVATTPGRLRDSREIVAVLRGGRHRAGRFVVLHGRDGEAGRVTDGNSAPAGVGPSTGQADARLAVVASRKVGNAVNRNRAKRVLREAARRVDWEPGSDLVLVARADCATTTMPVVLEELQDLAAQLRLGRAAA